MEVDDIVRSRSNFHTMISSSKQKYLNAIRF